MLTAALTNSTMIGGGGEGGGGSTNGIQVKLYAMQLGDAYFPSPAMLQTASFIMARNDQGDGRYYRLNCDSSGRLKTLFGAHISVRYRTAAREFEEQGSFGYGIALNRVIVTNSSIHPTYLFMCDQSTPLAEGDGSDFPILTVPAESHLAIEWLYPITTSYGLAFGLSSQLQDSGAPYYRGAGAVAKWLVECSS